MRLLVLGISRRSATKTCLLTLLAAALAGLALAAGAQAAAPSLTEEIAALNALRNAAGEPTLPSGGPLPLQIAQEAFTAEQETDHVLQGTWRGSGQVCSACDGFQLDGSPDFLTPQARYAAVGGTGTLALALLQGPLSLAGEARRAEGILLDPRAVSLDLLRDSQGLMMLAVVIDPSKPFTRPITSWAGLVDPALTSGVGVLVPQTVKGAGSLWELRGSTLVRLAAQDGPGWLYAHVEDTVGGARFVSFGDAFDGDLQLSYGARYHFRVGSLDLPFATRTFPAAAAHAGFRFASVSAAERAAVSRYLAQAAPSFRRMVALVDGLTTIQVAPLSACGTGSSGCETWDGDRYLVTFAPGVIDGRNGRFILYSVLGSVLADTGFDSTTWNAWQSFMRRQSPVAFARATHTAPLSGIAADQFAYLAAGGASGGGGYGEGMLCPAATLARWLAENWKLRPLIEQNPLAPEYLRLG